MAASSPEKRILNLKDNEVFNWQKVVQGLHIVRDALVNPLMEKMKEFQEQLIKEIKGKVCGICTNKNIKWKWDTDLKKTIKTFEPNCEICKKWFIQIMDKHVNKTGGERCYNFSMISLPDWSTVGRSWEIAKVFMSNGQNKASAAETDCVGLISILNNCELVKDWSTTEQNDKIHTLRNTVMHTGDGKVTEDELNEYFYKMEIFLKELKISNHVHEYIKKLQQLLKETSREVELEIILKYMQTRQEMMNEEQKAYMELANTFGVDSTLIAIDQTIINFGNMQMGDNSFQGIHEFDQQLSPVTRYKEPASSTLHGRFRDKWLIDIPGIGGKIVGELKNKGFTKAYHLLPKFLDMNEEDFKKWFNETSGNKANKKRANSCCEYLKKYADEHI